MPNFWLGYPNDTYVSSNMPDPHPRVPNDALLICPQKDILMQSLTLWFISELIIANGEFERNVSHMNEAYTQTTFYQTLEVCEKAILDRVKYGDKVYKSRSTDRFTRQTQLAGWYEHTADIYEFCTPLYFDSNIKDKIVIIK